MTDKTLEERAEVFQGVEMCKGEPQTVVTIRINGKEILLYGDFAAHYDILLRNREDQATALKKAEDRIKELGKALNAEQDFREVVRNGDPSIEDYTHWDAVDKGTKQALKL